MTTTNTSSTEAGVIIEDIEALANAISMQGTDPDSEKQGKRKPKDMNLEIAKLRSELKAAQNKITSLETDLRVARDSVPDLLKKSAEQGLAAAKLAANIMVQASGGMLQFHDIMPSLWDGKLHLSPAGKLVTK